MSLKNVNGLFGKYEKSLYCISQTDEGLITELLAFDKVYQRNTWIRCDVGNE